MKKIFSLYSGLSKQVKASLWFIISNVMVKGISFFTLPVFSRLLSLEEYGIVTVYQTWTSFITILSTLTIWGGVFNVSMVKYQDRQDEVVSSYQGLATTLTIVFAFLHILLYRFLNHLFKMPFLFICCMYAEILFQIPFNLWSTKQRYEFEYRNLILITIAISILNPVLGILAVSSTVYKAEARIISNLLVQAVIGLFFFTYNQSKGKKFFSLDLWKYGFLFNVTLIPHYLSMQILNQSDRIMIGNMCGTEDVAVYNMACNFAMLLSLVTSGINSSLTPHIYQSLGQGRHADLKRQTSSVVFLVALITMGLIAFVPDLFRLLLPESYYPALRSIPPVTAGAFFLFLYPLFGSIEFFYEENKFVTIASSFGAILNIILNLVFIRKFGYIAAAYTTLVCYALLSFFHYIFMKKILEKKSSGVEVYDGKKILYISLFVFFGSILMELVYENAFIRWGIIILMLLYLCLNRKELVEIMGSVIRRSNTEQK